MIWVVVSQADYNAVSAPPRVTLLLKVPSMSVDVSGCHNFGGVRLQASSGKRPEMIHSCHKDLYSPTITCSVGKFPCLPEFCTFHTIP